MENQSVHSEDREPRRPRFLTAGNAVKVLCVGTVLGTALRMVQMLYFYDYDTGFYTDGGVMAGVSMAIVVLAGLLAAGMCFSVRRYFGRYVSKASFLLGVQALLSGVLLIGSGVLQTLDYVGYLRTGYSSYDSARRGLLHVTFFALCFLFGLVQLVAAAGAFQGRNLFRRAPLLYLVGVLWGVDYLILVYVFYAKSSSFVENFFAVAGAASTCLALFYLCKLFAGVEEESAARRLFLWGGFAVVIPSPYALANLMLRLLGKTYVGEIPPAVQLASLGVALFLLVFLVGYRRDSMRRTPLPPARKEPRRQRPSQSRFHAD